jgi:mono/diheme cytochrome c family protein
MRVLRIAATGFLAATAWMMAGSTTSVTPSLLAAQAAPASTYQDVYNGWKWWHVYCFRCHGTDAIATSTAPSLIEQNGQLSRAQFLKIVKDGLPEKGMQAWNKLLDDRQIAQIHLYVRARAGKVLPPGRPDEVGPGKGPWEPPKGWPGR